MSTIFVVLRRNLLAQLFSPKFSWYICNRKLNRYVSLPVSACSISFCPFFLIWQNAICTARWRYRGKIQGDQCILYCNKHFCFLNMFSHAQMWTSHWKEHEHWTVWVIFIKSCVCVCKILHSALSKQLKHRIQPTHLFISMECHNDRSEWAICWCCFGFCCCYCRSTHQISRKWNLNKISCPFRICNR